MTQNFKKMIRGKIHIVRSKLDRCLASLGACGI